MVGRYEGKTVVRFEKWRKLPLNWSLDDSQAKPAANWDMTVRADLGLDDSDSRRFDAMAEKLLSGNLYPPNVADFYGPWQGRLLRTGDRILQACPLFPRLGGPLVWSMVEVYIAQQTEESVTLGYLTTEAHFAKGSWTAKITRANRRLTLEVTSSAVPKSMWFSAGLAYAKRLQHKATMRAVESLTRIG